MSVITVTNGEALDLAQINSDGIEHLDLEVPILTRPQRQGDVLVLPVGERKVRGDAVPPRGVTVVRGETEGGNAHIVHALYGECLWAPNPDAETDLAQGWLTVTDESAATVIHTQEHNVLGVGPGTYEIRRQREFAGEWRRVSD